MFWSILFIAVTANGVFWMFRGPAKIAQPGFKAQMAERMKGLDIYTMMIGFSTVAVPATLFLAVFEVFTALIVFIKGLISV